MKQTIDKVCKTVSKLHRLGIYMSLEEVVRTIKQELDVDVDDEVLEREVLSRIKFKLKVA